MFIPDEKIGEIRERADIVEVISDYVHLKKSGKNFVGLCPFHSEKTPSFTVNREKGIFYCFGCHEGGDVFTFLMKIKNMGFFESVLELARVYNIRVDLKREKGEALRDEILRINKIACEYFFNLLRSNLAEEARRYITYRGITGEIIDKFLIGYAPPDWRSLFNYLRKKGFAPELIEKSGLIIETKDGNYYDRFRNRIMFPIRETGGSIVGFGSRAIDESEPKYMNSPESPVFIKGRILYGIYECKEHIEREGKAFLVEGYFDHLTLFQAGVRNVVALCGTALGVNHIRRLKKYASQIYLVFDGDEAGMRALARSLQIILDEEINARSIVLPQGYDPDSFVKEKGKDAFYILVEGAMPLFETVLNYFISETKEVNFEGKKRVIELITPYVISIKNPIERERSIKVISERVGLREEIVREAIFRKADRSSSEIEPMRIIETQRPYDIDPAEKAILQVIIHHPEHIDLLMEKGVISYIKNGLVKDLLNDVLNSGSDTDIKKKIFELDAQKRSLITRLIMENPTWEGEPRDFLEGCISKLYERYIKEQIRGLLDQLKNAQEKGDEETTKKILRDINRLNELRRKNEKREKIIQ